MIVNFQSFTPGTINMSSSISRYIQSIRIFGLGISHLGLGPVAVGRQKSRTSFDDEAEASVVVRSVPADQRQEST